MALLAPLRSSVAACQVIRVSESSLIRPWLGGEGGKGLRRAAAPGPQALRWDFAPFPAGLTRKSETRRRLCRVCSMRRRGLATAVRAAALPAPCAALRAGLVGACVQWHCGSTPAPPC